MGNKKIDDFFKQILEGEDHSFNEDHWKELEKRLPNPIKSIKRSSYLIWKRLAIAASIVIFCVLGIKLYYSFNDIHNLNNKKNNMALTPVKPNQKEESSPSLDKGISKENQWHELNKKNKETTFDFHRPYVLNRPLPYAFENQENDQKKEESYSDISLLDRQMMYGVDINDETIGDKLPLIAERDLVLSRSPKIDEEINSETIKLKKASFNQGSTLSILAGPDLTNVKGSGLNSVSSNIGVLFTKPLSGKISVSTGLIYSKKNYSSAYSLYRAEKPLPAGYYPTNVDAKCDILSIPISVNVNVINSGKNSIGLSVGSSSLFMLKENYTFSYTDMEDKEYEIKNQNQHYFGTVDLSVTLQRKISNQFKIGVKPFIQIPLKGVGYGQTSLQSKGIALTIDYGLK